MYRKILHLGAAAGAREPMDLVSNGLAQTAIHIHVRILKEQSSEEICVKQADGWFIYVVMEYETRKKPYGL